MCRDCQILRRHGCRNRSIPTCEGIACLGGIVDSVDLIAEVAGLGFENRVAVIEGHAGAESLKYSDEVLTLGIHGAEISEDGGAVKRPALEGVTGL